MYTHVHIHTLIYTHKQIIIKTQYSQGGKWFIMTVVKYHCLTVPTADGKGLFTTFNTMENIKKRSSITLFLKHKHAVLCHDSPNEMRLDFVRHFFPSELIYSALIL